MFRRLAQAVGPRALAQGAGRAGTYAGCSTSFAAGALARNTQAFAPSPLLSLVARFKSGGAFSTPGLKSYKPTTPGFRGRVTTSRKDLWKGGPFKALTVGMRKTGGRDGRGRVSNRHMGGGHRKVWRAVDFRRAADCPDATVLRLEYDPNRSARIALVQLDVPETRTVEVPRQAADGSVETVQRIVPVPLKERFAYVIAPEGISVGSVLRTGPDAPVTDGNSLPLANIPVGMPIHNIELYPGRGGQLVRAAGASASIVKKAERYATIRLPSGEQRLVLLNCVATMGTVGNAQHKNRKLGKAGAARWSGRRPRVRGVAMNACDHPHGGGRGKSKGVLSKTAWGFPTKGYRTRRKRRMAWAVVVSKHNAKRKA